METSGFLMKISEVTITKGKKVPLNVPGYEPGQYDVRPYQESSLSMTIQLSEKEKSLRREDWESFREELNTQLDRLLYNDPDWIYEQPKLKEKKVGEKDE